MTFKSLYVNKKKSLLFREFSLIGVEFKKKVFKIGTGPVAFCARTPLNMTLAGRFRRSYTPKYDQRGAVQELVHP